MEMAATHFLPSRERGPVPSSTFLRLLLHVSRRILKEEQDNIVPGNHAPPSGAPGLTSCREAPEEPSLAPPVPSLCA